MVSKSARRLLAPAVLFWLAALPAGADAIVVQCPASTEKSKAEGTAIKCIHLSAGDGFVTMADGRPLYTFGFSLLNDPQTGRIITDPQTAINQGTLAANFPAPTIFVDQGDELFLTLTNVGMLMRPDLFDPHSIHWHGFPNAAAVFDGVPDSSTVINMGASFTYYYNVAREGTYMYHCHVEATEHMQMGMLGSLYVRPRQDRLPAGSFANGLAHAPIVRDATGKKLAGNQYAYNDGDGSTDYDRQYPIQIGSFDPVFHERHVQVQPLPFADMHDTYYMLNGRGYPDTVHAGPLPNTVWPDLGSLPAPSQRVDSLIKAAPGEKVLLRISNLNVTEFNTLGTVGIPMRIVGLDARLLRAGTQNQSYKTFSITVGGGQSADAILDIPADATPGTTYFLYSTNLQYLANDRQNFGGMMTEIQVQ